MARQRAGSRSDPVMRSEVIRLASGGLKPPQILGELERLQADEANPLHDRVLLSLKVIRDIVKENPPPSPIALPVSMSEQWSPAEDRTGNPSIVLAMLRELIEWTSGSITRISHENAG